MDSSLYKTTTVSRGLTYNYYHSPATGTQPTLLLSHGFPSTSYDWHRVVAGLKPYGYGLVVPDQLGYGGTSKPLDAESYKPSLIAKDLVEILDAAGVDKVIAVGHDWGSKMTSRLVNYFPERVIAAAFFALWYLTPDPNYDVHKMNAITKQMLGYEAGGYQVFLGSEPDAAELISEHIDSLLPIIFPHDPELWIKNMAPLGALRAWLVNKRTAPRPSYLSEEEYKTLGNTLKSGTIAAPLNYYTIITSGINAEDDKQISEDRYEVQIPVFFGAAMRDYVCLAQLGKDHTARRCTNPSTVTKEYDGDHWIILSHAEQIANDLHAWIEGLKVGDSKL